MKPYLITAAIITAAGVSGCAHTHLRGPLPSYSGADAATLYVQRPPSATGIAGAMHIVLDGHTLGVIGPDEYWRLSLRPGKHTLGTYSTSTPIMLDPGSVSCITVEFAMMSSSVVIHPAETCPPPSSWKDAANSDK